jgi:hypothetical protein
MPGIPCNRSAHCAPDTAGAFPQRTPELPLTMLRSLPSIALAAAAIAACLLGLSWLTSVWLGRHLSLGELAAATVLLLVALACGLSVWRTRNRRKVQDMRDSALW